MKGVVFTEFLEMVDEKFSPQVTEQIIESARLPNAGAYSAVGTYDHRELVRLLAELHKACGVAVPELLCGFGRHLLGRFRMAYPGFFAAATDTFGFLHSIDGHIHVEVRKLYPDAELPKFDCQRIDGNRMEMIYRSARCMSSLAEGLIRGAIEHFGEPIAVATEDLSDGKGTCVRFLLSRHVQ